MVRARDRELARIFVRARSGASRRVARVGAGANA